MSAQRSIKFRCEGCKAEIPYGMYALAQLAQGRDLIFTHDKNAGGCGKRTVLTKRKLHLDSERQVTLPHVAIC